MSKTSDEDPGVVSMDELKHGTMPEPIRIQMLNGTFLDKSGKKSRYNKIKYRFMLDAPFWISNKCCNVMKKAPMHKYSKETGRFPITAQMAAESMVRTQKWLINGCNAFDVTQPISNPMSFWFEQDVLLYIKEHNLPMASVYGEIIVDTKSGGQINGQMSLSDMGIFDLERPTLTTTGCERTGCMFCLFGIAQEKEPNRLQKLHESHPKVYNYLMRPESEGGMGYKDKIDWINEHGGFHIKY